MLPGIETGYEAEFDFPPFRGPPPRPYLLASVPRSGSTFVSHLLWQTGCLGAPLEYCNFDPNGPYGDAHQSQSEQQRLWREVLIRRTSPNGVFGLKGFPVQFEALQRDNPALLAEVMRDVLPSRARGRIVLLRRRDRTAHAISYARAIISGIWRAEQEREEMTEPEYSRIAVERAERMIESQEGAWRAMLVDLGIEPLMLWYEDVLTAPGRAIDAVAEYLEIEIDPSAAVKIPRIERQSQDGARTWARQHAGG
ncbi:MAG TPA: Stf0 family sulfotransferase [Croceibacterium sp.]|jgi:LPS sulfotransferase NodH